MVKASTKTFSRNVKSELRRLGKTFEDLQTKTGLSRRTIGRIEANERDGHIYTPSYETTVIVNAAIKDWARRHSTSTTSPF